jgi:hypothetical protein
MHPRRPALDGTGDGCLDLQGFSGFLSDRAERVRQVGPDVRGITALQLLAADAIRRVDRDRDAAAQDEHELVSVVLPEGRRLLALAADPREHGIEIAADEQLREIPELVRFAVCRPVLMIARPRSDVSFAGDLIGNPGIARHERLDWHRFRTGARPTAPSTLTVASA